MSIKITQYVRPHGRKREVFADLRKEYEKRAKGLEFSCEVLPDGRVAIYAKREGESDEKEHIEIADNVLPGQKSENGPNEVLCRMIDKLNKKEKRAGRGRQKKCGAVNVNET
jgi:hypothetical protein